MNKRLAILMICGVTGGVTGGIAASQNLSLIQILVVACLTAVVVVGTMSLLLSLQSKSHTNH